MLGYKIENNIASLFDGDELPEGFVAYEVGGEPQELVDLLSAQADEAASVARVAELKRLLQESDYAVLPDYDKPSDEIKAQRAAWRDELRNLLA